MRTAAVCSVIAVGLLPAAGAISGAAEVTNTQEIVVSATRLSTPANEVASSITVVTSNEIQRRQAPNVASALESVPGLSVSRYGGPGAPASVFIRGAKEEYTLILVDGIEVNDPSSIGRAGALESMDVADIDRIEVLRGPQSCLYGADALAGVINIVTKRGAGSPHATLQAEGGSYNTFRESANISGATGMVDYAFTATRFDTDGFSAARRQDGNSEKDGHASTSLSGRVGLAPMEEFNMDFIARYLQSRTEFDAAGGPGGDSIGDLATEERLFLRAQAHANLADSRWQQDLGASYSDHDRDSRSAWGNSTFEGQITKADWKHDVQITDGNTLTVGGEVEREKAETDQLPAVSADAAGVFVQDRVNAADSFFATAGGRYDHHDAFGDEWTYRVAPMFVIVQTSSRMRATYGTGFKAPSLYQLYAPASVYGPIGNPDLEAETSRGWDAGVDQPFGDRLMAGMTWFENRYDNMIDFENGYVNRTRAETRGLEVTTEWKATDDLTLRGAYTYTHAEDTETGEALIRRPKHRATLDAAYRWNAKIQTGAQVMYVGRREDKFFPADMSAGTDVTLPSYTLVNLYASYQIHSNLELYARVENLFNVDYEEIKGYGTAGLSAYGGIKLSL